MTVTVKEITRVKPNMVRVLVIDEKFIKYPLVNLTTVDSSHPTTSWVLRNNPHNGGASEYCRVIGDGTWLQFEDVEPTAFLDRDEAGDYTNYPDLGAASPVAVYKKDYPNNQGEAQAGRSINCRHELFVEYDITIPDGTYTFSVTGDFIPSTTFVVSDKITRCDTIRATQHGHKPTDPEKAAALSVWIPGYGTEGAVDLDTEFSIVGENFYIINEAGTIVHTGTIALRIGPTDQENSTASAIALTRYPSTTIAPKRVAGQVTKGNPTSFEVTGHGYSTGQYKFFFGFSGLGSNFDYDTHQITVTDADNFTVAVDTSSASDHAFDTYLEAHDSQVYDTHLANRGATYIYDLDYSSFEPTSGNYGEHRVYVPGFGVSWPFQVDPAVRYIAAKNSVKGYMSQCWGLPLSSGSAGWNRPAQFRDGKNGQQVFESTKPGSWDVEGGYFFGGVGGVSGMPALWRTTNSVTDWFGAYSDAGDWDFHHYRHCASLYELLDMAYEFVPASQRNVDYGFPKSSQTIDKDLYGAIDSLGDAIHMVIWYLDPFRRHQHADGWVYAGCQYTDGPEDETTTPSWLSQNDMYLLAADHLSSFYYAWVAGKLARLLDEAGVTSLAATWLASAEAAYDWANDIWEDWDTNGISSTGAWRDWYITELDFQTNSGLSNADMTTHMDAINAWVNNKSVSTRGIRLCAATTLWRANGDTNDSYNTIIKDATAWTTAGLEIYSGWEYLNGTDLGDNDTARAALASSINDRADQINGGQIADEYCYKNGYDDGITNTNNVQPMGPAIPEFHPWYNEEPAGDFTKYLELVCAAEDYVNGRNQQGMSFTTGIGHNPPDPILVRDQEHAHISPTPGFTIYVREGPSGSADFSHLFGGIHRFPATSDDVSQSWSPPKAAYPIHEQNTRNTYDVYSTEFVTQIQIVGRFCNNVWLHTWDETGTTQLVNAPISASISF